VELYRFIKINDALLKSKYNVVLFIISSKCCHPLLTKSIHKQRISLLLEVTKIMR
jgi:hypothetical protein